MAHRAGSYVICNSSMQHHFYDYEEIYMNDYVLSSTTMPIKGYEKINIKITKRGEPRIMTLLKVAYIPNYPTNLVSMSRVKTKEIY